MLERISCIYITLGDFMSTYDQLFRAKHVGAVVMRREAER